MTDDKKIPMSRAVLWILLSTLLISGSVLMGWLYYLHVRELRLNDDQYRIAAIIQRTPHNDSLKTAYLAEQLKLSLSHPVNLYQFNVKEARETLLKNPLIRDVIVKKILPGTLYIDYTLRSPAAFVGDFTNTAIDAEGNLFPFRPFFTPKRLPIIILGLNEEECQWGNCISENPSLQVAFDLMAQRQSLEREGYEIQKIDVAELNSESYGHRQIVVVLGWAAQSIISQPEGGRRIILRLSVDQPHQDLINFLTLNDFLLKRDQKSLVKNRPVVIDLRMPHLAFIKAES